MIFMSFSKLTFQVPANSESSHIPILTFLSFNFISPTSNNSPADHLSITSKTNHRDTAWLCNLISNWKLCDVQSEAMLASLAEPCPVSSCWVGGPETERRNISNKKSTRSIRLKGALRRPIVFGRNLLGPQKFNSWYSVVFDCLAPSLRFQTYLFPMSNPVPPVHDNVTRTPLSVGTTT